jgi:hypothetical protein
MRGMGLARARRTLNSAMVNGMAVATLSCAAMILPRLGE